MPQFIYTIAIETSEDIESHIIDSMIERASYDISESLWEESDLKPWALTTTPEGSEYPSVEYRFEPDEEEY